MYRRRLICNHGLLPQILSRCCRNHFYYVLRIYLCKKRYTMEMVWFEIVPVYTVYPDLLQIIFKSGKSSHQKNIVIYYLHLVNIVFLSDQWYNRKEILDNRKGVTNRRVKWNPGLPGLNMTMRKGSIEYKTISLHAVTLALWWKQADRGYLTKQSLKSEEPLTLEPHQRQHPNGRL